jgi:hypothetical protein
VATEAAWLNGKETEKKKSKNLSQGKRKALDSGLRTSCRLCNVSGAFITIQSEHADLGQSVRRSL